MKAGQRCTFCEKPATQDHHVAGHKHCTWFLAPVCVGHHQRITSAYYNANPDMMKATSEIQERSRRAREGCLVFLWLLDHPEEIDLEKMLR
jgi:hypothetical protein